MFLISDVFLDTSGKISDTERRGGAWTRYETYETYETVRDDRGDWWLKAPRRGNRAHEYSPLIEYRALFHEFARLWEENHGHHFSGGSRTAARVAQGWAEKYGLLGTR